jgi:chorismate mutase
MSTHHPDLDLQGRIRPGLDILANEIVIALKKRTRFVVNGAVYEPGLLRGDESQSLLMYTLGKIEHSHAELGRYTFAEQDAFTDVHGIESVIARNAPQSPLRQMPSGVGDRIIDFYRQWIDNACEAGDESSTYGETVTADAVALLAIMERVNLGKLVAESKFLELQPQFIETGGDREAMLALIVRRDREVKVLELAERLAEHYELPPQHAVSVFEFMIATTIDIEVDYLRLRIAEATAATG